jgi:type VI protein secretion system component VasK
MDPFFPLVFGFVLLLVLLVGGFIVLFPLTRQLGAYLEMQLEKRREQSVETASLEAIQRELRQLSDQLRDLAERQSFTDELLAQRPEGRLLAEESTTGEAKPGPAAGS